MKKELATFAFSALAAVVLAEAPATTPDGKAPKKLSREKIAYLQMKNFGGYVEDVRNQRGSIVVVNAQSAADPKWFEEVVAHLSKFVKVSFVVRSGKFEFPEHFVEGEPRVFVVDDPKLPQSLLAAENGWAMFNVAPLRAGDGAKPQFFKARVEKQLVRSLASLMGAADSQYPMSLCRCMTKPEDLDQQTETSLPIDVLNKLTKYVSGYGVTPHVRKTYKMAVSEGWAAQPTNEYQKAIWNEVHTLPTNPLPLVKPTK